MTKKYAVTAVWLEKKLHDPAFDGGFLSTEGGQPLAEARLRVAMTLRVYRIGYRIGCLLPGKVWSRPTEVTARPGSRNFYFLKECP